MSVVLAGSPHKPTVNDLTFIKSHSNANVSLPDPSSVESGSICPGCRKSVVDDTGGVVVAFGASFFHVQCFKCAKCSNQVTADTNLLLLSDGSPICSNCSYNCNVCHRPILDEAIMTGDDSYHAQCFRCRVCKNLIDEMVFAKTSQGIYCMTCHSDRVARSRRHAERKKEQARERIREETGERGAGRSRERAIKESERENGAGTSSQHSRSHSPYSPPSTGMSSSPLRPTTPQERVLSSVPQRSSSKRSLRSLTDAQRIKELAQGMSVSPSEHSDGRQASSPSPFSVSVAPPPSNQPDGKVGSTTGSWADSPTPPYHVSDNQGAPGSPSTSQPRRNASLPIPTLVNSPERSERGVWRSGRKSVDIGIAPDNSALDGDRGSSLSNTGGIQGLHVPNKGVSRTNKRRSINPGLGLSQYNNSGSPPSPTSSLHSITPPAYTARSQTPPAHGHDSPHMPSPLREHYSEQDSVHSDFPTMKSNDSAPFDLYSFHEGPVTSDRHPDLYYETRSRTVSSTAYTPDVPVERLPPRMNSLGHDSPRPQPSSATSSRFADEQGGRSPSLSASDPSVRSRRSFDDRSRPQLLKRNPESEGRLSPASLNLDIDRPGTRTSDRSCPTTPTSPSHRVDVPQGVESGTDTDAEGEGEHRVKYHALDDAPPAPPPKESKDKTGVRPQQLQLQTTEIAPDLSYNSSANNSPSEEESEPVQRTSRTTFIAPALPPIRISMNTADFSDLLKSIGGPFKSFEQLSMLTEEDLDKKSSETSTPPPPTSPSSFADSSPAQTPTNKSSFTSQSLSSSSSQLPSPSPNKDRHATKVIFGADGVRQKSRNGPGHSSNSSASSTSSLNLPRRTISDSRPFDDGESSRLSLDRRTVSQPSPTRARSSSESGYYSQSIGLDSTTSLSIANSYSNQSGTRITLTVPGSPTAKPSKPDRAELVLRRLQEVLSDATDRRASHVKLDKDFVQAILMIVEQKKTEESELKGRLDGMKRTSQNYMEGLTVAQAEYDQEVKARREAETEVTRLRVLLSSQTARLSAISSESKRQELQEQISRNLTDNLTGLERDVSKLKVERDLTIAEVEELSASKSSPNLDSVGEGPISRTLSVRFDNIKSQYARELVPLNEQKEVLTREITELKAFRDQFLEETAVLGARNEELAQLNHQYIRQIDAVMAEATPASPIREKQSGSFDSARPNPTSLTSSVTSSSTLTDESTDSKFVKVQKPDVSDTPSSTMKPAKFIKWPGSKTTREPVAASVVFDANKKGPSEHNFVPLNVLRFARCDHCGDKMFGSQYRCSKGCNIAVHPRCLQHVQITCSRRSAEEPSPHIGPLPPSMFGRDLIEQVKSDWKNGEQLVPVIVEKCIDAVEALALDYEGIYRKTGGSGQSKMITQLFERGDYSSFDLRDPDRFNDICSVTSVLKTYFRQLPNPLLTYALHDNFVAASNIRDPSIRMEVLSELLSKLPQEHYHTLRILMLHLHRVLEHRETNLMTARNLGVVFGPTLMRSRDPSAEFTDMGAKALSVEWLVENACLVFDQ